MTHRLEATAMEPAAIASVRHLVVEHLDSWGCGDTNDDVAVVLSELVTNAVVHAGGAVKIAVVCGGRRVRIEVHDNGSGRPHIPNPDSIPGGLGLHIVAQLSERWGSEPTSTGKLVWAILQCETHG
jgi:anti-sigma regulatory factor (Ser/Thr protein kinase)